MMQELDVDEARIAWYVSDRVNYPLDISLPLSDVPTWQEFLCKVKLPLSGITSHLLKASSTEIATR